MRGIIVIVLLVTMPLTQGCAMAIGIGMASIEEAIKKKKPSENDVKNEYNNYYIEYVRENNQINIKNEKARLPKEKVMSFDEWIKTVYLPPEKEKILRPKIAREKNKAEI
jgi:hypothetical protein